MLGNEMFKFQEGVVSRWASHENPDGAKAQEVQSGMAEKELPGLH